MNATVAQKNGYVAGSSRRARRSTARCPSPAGPSALILMAVLAAAAVVTTGCLPDELEPGSLLDQPPPVNTESLTEPADVESDTPPVPELDPQSEIEENTAPELPEDPEPIPAADADTTAAPEPEPDAELAPVPDAELEPDPEPEPDSAPAGAPATRPEPTPEPDIAPTPTPTPEPNPEPEPTPEPVPDPEPDPPAPRANLAPAEDALVVQLFSAGLEITQLCEVELEHMAEALWAAAEAGNGQFVLSGTLQQVDADQGSWQYTPTPEDRLVVRYADGRVVDYTFNALGGYTEGEPYDFVHWEHEVDVHILQPGVMDLRIVSTARSAGDGYTSEWERQIVGALQGEAAWMTVNLVDTGNCRSEVDYGYVDNETERTTRGTIEYGNVLVDVNDSYWIHLIGYESLAKDVWQESNSVAQMDGVTYQFDQARARWEGIMLTNCWGAAEPDYWFAAGGLLIDGRPAGVMQLLNAPASLDESPELILELADGTSVLVHHLLNDF